MVEKVLGWWDLAKFLIKDIYILYVFYMNANYEKFTLKVNVTMCDK